MLRTQWHGRPGPFLQRVTHLLKKIAGQWTAEKAGEARETGQLILSAGQSKVTQSCPTLCDPMDCSLSGSSVHGIFQARVLEWIAIFFSRGSSRPRNRTRVSRVAGRRFTVWATREASGKSSKEAPSGPDLWVGFDYAEKSKGSSSWGNRRKPRPMARNCDPNPRESEEASLACVNRPRERREGKLRKYTEAWWMGPFVLWYFNIRTSLVAQMVKRLPTMWQTQVQSPGREDLLEKEMATHSNILAWKIPWTEEPGRLQSMGSQRVRHDWATSLFFQHIKWFEFKRYKRIYSEKSLSHPCPQLSYSPSQGQPMLAVSYVPLQRYFMHIQENRYLFCPSCTNSSYIYIYIYIYNTFSI